MTTSSQWPVVTMCIAVLAAYGCATVPPKSLNALDGSITQAVVVHADGRHPQQAALTAWQREGSRWRMRYLASAVLGRHGLAPGGRKEEGDGRTPSGVYALGPAFGYAPSIETGLAYRQASADDFWVDDADSVQYNQWVHGAPRARSFERLRRADNLYQYAVVIRYNMNPVVRRAGSAIFMHVWRRYDSATSGCVALNERHLRKILRWLNAADNPVLILE